MATIKPIEGRSVHQIQSGQVIVDLNSVVKELVENSLDAGATSIEVRFKNNGLDAIEVQDNGSGIAPADFESLALKHYTSKLSTYDDLTSLQTFGFRGEALSSLCALSKFHIVTARAEDGAKGTKLEFEQSGKLKGTSVVAAKQGTIVVVETLFYNLPVRRKELEKTIKREYNKVLQLLNAYACISVGVKFSVSNQIPKGKKTIAFSTNANPSTKENIANVYGAKALSALIPLDLKFEMDPSSTPGLTQGARSLITQEDEGSREVRIIGHISRPVFGEGRQTLDRQMFFVNSRPCLLPQVAKAFNEVYKSYNHNQSPFIFADIKLDTNAYDVNVSPDKKTILLHDQTTLLENLKVALVELFEGHDQSVPQAQLLNQKLPLSKSPALQRGHTVETPVEDRQSPTAISIDRDHSAVEPEETDLPSVGQETLKRGFIKASLIEAFAARDAKQRVAPTLARGTKSTSPEKPNTPPLAERINNATTLHGDEGSEQDMAADIQPPEQLPRIVQDFNARIASQHAKQMAREQSPLFEPDESEEEEEPISSIKQQVPQKRLSQSTIQNAFDRMRPMRIPIQQATITVGDTTTIETIGSESRAAKRARIHTPKFSLSGKSLSQTPKKPALLRSLRAFAAPGTQMEASDEDDDEDEDDQLASQGSDPDSSMTEEPAANSSPPRKSLPIYSSLDNFPTISTSGAPSPHPQKDEDAEEEPSPAPPAPEEEPSDDDYIDEAEKKAREEARVARLIAEAEEASARPSEQNLKRAKKLLHARRTYPTLTSIRVIETSIDTILRQVGNLKTSPDTAEATSSAVEDVVANTRLENKDPEERLTLTVSKQDFTSMRIIGQFNLGFILTLRSPTTTSPTPDLFIIDQHASDEKYNFERLSNTTVLESQRMVHPQQLELNAVEEEIISEHESVLLANGFKVDLDRSGEMQVGRRGRLTALPTSRGVTFTPKDLEELLALLQESPPSASSLERRQYIPRPSKVRSLLASRACRSSVMIGKTLKVSQMERVVRNMGTMDKPWTCPHGRPTMRHLFALENWTGWREADGVVGVITDSDGDSQDDDGSAADRMKFRKPGSFGGRQTDWEGYLARNRAS